MSKKNKKTKIEDLFLREAVEPITEENYKEKCRLIINNAMQCRENNTCINLGTRTQLWLGNDYPLLGEYVIYGKRSNADDPFGWIHVKPDTKLKAAAFIGGEMSPHAIWITEEDGNLTVSELEMFTILAISANKNDVGELGLLTYFKNNKVHICVLEGDPDLEAVRNLINDIGNEINTESQAYISEISNNAEEDERWTSMIAV